MYNKFYKIIQISVYSYNLSSFCLPSELKFIFKVSSMKEGKFLSTYSDEMEVSKVEGGP